MGCFFLEDVNVDRCKGKGNKHLENRIKNFSRKKHHGGCVFCWGGCSQNDYL